MKYTAQERGLAPLRKTVRYVLRPYPTPIGIALTLFPVT